MQALLLRHRLSNSNTKSLFRLSSYFHSSSCSPRPFIPSPPSASSIATNLFTSPWSASQCRGIKVSGSDVCMHLLTLSLMVMYYAVIQSQITIGTNFKIIIVEVNKFTIHGGLRMNDGVLLLYGVSASPIFSLIFTIFIYFYWNLNRCFFTVSCGAD